jgi:glucose/arabinose dehydrogenase
VQTGLNQIAVKANNNGGVAAFILKLEIETADGKQQQISSTPDWKLSNQESPEWKQVRFDDSSWKLKLKSMGAFGSGPWGKPGITTRSGVDMEELAQNITIAKDFKVELLYEVPANEQGSWVSLTTDGKGRLLASDQGDKGLYRITVTEKGDAPQVDVEKMQIDLSGAQGMVWHKDALYFHKNGGNLFKVTDTNGDDQLDTAEVLPSERSGGEHGNHAVIVAEDNQHLYVIGGNHAALPPQDSIVRSHVPTWDEDLLLPREWDANGHARGRLAPGGWISRFSPETKQHEIISTGYRNEYDIALNRAGDIFTYDADMEWDLGTPWYRPTRINVAVSGSDYGWRSGSGKWPEYYEDSLPAVVNIGPGCPTGVISGQGAKFPARYQDAMFALDWTFGTIYAIHLTPDGAGYKGEQEAFCYGSPLPLTDAIIGKDGALYFTIGGRGT